MLQAYQIKRRPIAIRNGTGSTKNFKVWKEDTGRDRIFDDGPAADAQRQAIGENMAATMRQEFQAVGLALGYDYGDSPLVISDGSVAPPNEPELYIPTARPGHGAPPHVWLDKGRSTMDLFGGGFVLLCFGNADAADDRIVDEVVARNMPLRIEVIHHAEAAALYERRLLLVRPDGMVAWRGDGLPEEVGDVLDKIRGVL